MDPSICFQSLSPNFLDYSKGSHFVKAGFKILPTFFLFHGLLNFYIDALGREIYIQGERDCTAWAVVRVISNYEK